MYHPSLPMVLFFELYMNIGCVPHCSVNIANISPRIAKHCCTIITVPMLYRRAYVFNLLVRAANKPLFYAKSIVWYRANLDRFQLQRKRKRWFIPVASLFSCSVSTATLCCSWNVVSMSSACVRMNAWSLTGTGGDLASLTGTCPVLAGDNGNCVLLVGWTVR